MREIIARLPTEIFEVVTFGDECILEKPIEEWPIVECLIAFYSGGYPLMKAIEYVSLRQPYLINDLKMQIDLQDRRRVYELLTKHGIDVPRHVYLERDDPSKPCELEEHDDHIVVNGVHIRKPLVEKPVDADDHNIYIYYPMSAGGGSKRLFRKVNNRSSEFYRSENDVRRTGSYIYEEFLNTQGTDVKVYTVGDNYGHAEARKSPVVDGKVHRDANGLEVRYPVILSPAEKEITRKITLAFKQTVCGFDLLRIQGGKSYVCDVNGWSFVKKNRKYYDDCARILAETMLLALRPECHSTLSTVQPLTLAKHVQRQLKNYQSTGELARPPSPASRGESSGSNTPNAQVEDEEELLCVISVIRHGDRTPKQKMKLKVVDPRYLDYFHEQSKSPTKNLKLKSRRALLEFLEVTKTILSEGQSKWYGNNAAMFVKLQRVRDVLEQHEITGVNRKLQIKPERWSEVCEVGDDGTVRRITRATHLLIILKWGGVLTGLGEKQAEDLGETFRTSMYPDPSGGGVLRLHSTFRHDLKIKASDEGRVMKTAAAFTKGLLELEGDLTPVLVSLVTVQENNQMLDHYDNIEIKNDVDRCKARLNRVLQMDTEFTPDMLDGIAPECNSFMKETLLRLGNPRKLLAEMHCLVSRLCDDIQAMCSRLNDGEELPVLYMDETYELMLYRWETLNRDFFNEKEKGVYDLSKVPELHDMARYDVLHNFHLNIDYLDELFKKSKLFADCVVPLEYGIDATDKRNIGIKMCSALLHKIQYDLNVAKSGTRMDMQYHLDHSHGEDLAIRTLGRCVRTRLYFTSESHLYTLLNVLGHPACGSCKVFSAKGQRILDTTSELSYLTQISIRLFDVRSKNLSDPEKYRCEILFSPGANSDPCIDKSGKLAKPVVLNKSICCDELIRCFGIALGDVRT